MNSRGEAIEERGPSPDGVTHRHDAFRIQVGLLPHPAQRRAEVRGEGRHGGDFDVVAAAMPTSVEKQD